MGEAHVFLGAVGTQLDEFRGGVAVDGEIPKNTGGPLAELRGADGIDPVADRYDGVQIVVLGLVGFAVGGSYPEFPNN